MKVGPYTGPKPKGMADPKIEGCILVPLDKAPDHPQFPQLYSPLLIPKTYYRYVVGDKKVRCMVTVMPNDLHVAWFTCQNCSQEFRLCTCKQGVSTPRSIEYIFDQIAAWEAGEEWSPHHPNYNGSRRQALRNKARKPAWESGGPVITPKSRKAAEAPSEPRKTGGLTRRKAAPAPEAPEPDMNTINKAAAESADESTRELERRLTRKASKTKSQPQKKSKLNRKKKK